MEPKYFPTQEAAQEHADEKDLLAWPTQASCIGHWDEWILAFVAEGRVCAVTEDGGMVLEDW